VRSVAAPVRRRGTRRQSADRASRRNWPRAPQHDGDALRADLHQVLPVAQAEGLLVVRHRVGEALRCPQRVHAEPVELGSPPFVLAGCRVPGLRFRHDSVSGFFILARHGVLAAAGQRTSAVGRACRAVVGWPVVCAGQAAKIGTCAAGCRVYASASSSSLLDEGGFRCRPGACRRGVTVQCGSGQRAPWIRSGRPGSPASRARPQPRRSRSVRP